MIGITAARIGRRGRIGGTIVAPTPRVFRVIVLALAVVTTLAAPNAVAAEPIWPGTPTDAVRRYIDELAGIMASSNPKPSGRWQAARAAVTRAFDFPELSRRALGEHWPRLTTSEREDFTTGLRALLTSLCASRLGHDGAGGAEQRGIAARVERLRQRVRYLGESASGRLADVRMSLTHAGQDLPVQVALIQRGREWRIVDVAVDGIRLTDTLRAQVDHLSRGTDYGEVLDRLRARE